MSFNVWINAFLQKDLQFGRDILISIIPIQNRKIYQKNLNLQTIFTSIHPTTLSQSINSAKASPRFPRSFSSAILTFTKFHPLKVLRTYRRMVLAKVVFCKIKEREGINRRMKHKTTRKGTAAMHGRSWRKFQNTGMYVRTYIRSLDRSHIPRSCASSGHVTYPRNYYVKRSQVEISWRIYNFLTVWEITEKNWPMLNSVKR